MVERRLGRGLDFFLSRNEKGKDSPPVGDIQEVDLAALKTNPFQPRSEFNEVELRELADSIRANGVLQPILVRRVGPQLEIVAGERRWRAAKLAGLERIPAVVRDVPDEAAAVFALVENLQRADLNPMEKARALRRVSEATGASHEELARRLGLDRSTIANFVRLLDLAEPVQALVSRGTLTMGHARALLGLSAPEQQALAESAVRERLTVRDIESRAQERKVSAPQPAAGGAPPAGAKKSRPIWLNEIEDTLAEALGASVHVRYGRKRSLITVECRGREDFERVYEMLKTLESGSRQH